MDSEGHYKAYEQRHLRTDDIYGAQPKKYGLSLPDGNIAGAPTGNKKLRNQSEVFSHIAEIHN